MFKNIFIVKHKAKIQQKINSRAVTLKKIV